MSLNLPEPIVAYVIADNENDLKAAAECFTTDATVHDEGGTFVGLAAIQRWMAETKAKYQHTMKPLTYALTQSGGVVTMRLTGNFPGSPIEVKFAFVIEGDKISSLDIHS